MSCFVSLLDWLEHLSKFCLLCTLLVHTFAAVYEKCRVGCCMWQLCAHCPGDHFLLYLHVHRAQLEICAICARQVRCYPYNCDSAERCDMKAARIVCIQVHEGTPCAQQLQLLALQAHTVWLQCSCEEQRLFIVASMPLLQLSCQEQRNTVK